MVCMTSDMYLNKVAAINNARPPFLTYGTFERRVAWMHGTW